MTIPAQTIPDNLIQLDGYIVDRDSGEIVGLVTPKQSTSAFLVTDDESANWVLQKMIDAEADVLAVEQTPAVIAARAIIANATAVAKQREQRVDYLHLRFDADLGEYAKGKLGDSKSNTYKTVLGSISLRLTKGGVRVADEKTALATAKTVGWDNAIKTTEEFLISLLTPEQKEKAAELPGFEVRPDEEKVKVKTGVGA